MNNLINLQAFKKFPTLETDRLLLREYQDDDLSLMNHIRSDLNLLKYLDKSPHQNLTETKTLVELINKNYVDSKGLNWIVVDKSNNRPIGDVAIWHINHKNARGVIGYTLREDAWGKGYMTEALKTVIDFGFNQLKLHSFEADINPNNGASRNLLKKLNFRKEAYFKENYYFDGVYSDSEIYSLLKKWCTP